MDNTFPLFSIGEISGLSLPACDTLFGIINGRPEPVYFVDFQGKNFGTEDYNRLSDDDKMNLFQYQLQSNKYVRLISFLPTDEYIYLSLNYFNNSYVGVYDTRSNQYRIIKMRGLENDIFGSFISFYPCGAANKELVFSVSPVKVIADKSTPFYRKHENLLMSITETSNPVLVLGRLLINR